jgi:hypothetical protein
MSAQRLIICQGAHQGKRGRRIWYFQTGSPDGVLVVMILCDDGEVVHFQSAWTEPEEEASK